MVEIQNVLLWFKVLEDYKGNEDVRLKLLEKWLESSANPRTPFDLSLLDLSDWDREKGPHETSLFGESGTLSEKELGSDEGD